MQKNDPLKNPRIERHIIIGLVVSTPFLQRIRPVWQSSLLKSSAAKRIAKWCIDYYDRYNQAPNQHVETIFLQKVKEEKLPPEIAEEIEQDIFPSLSDEYERAQFNVEYVLEQALAYFSQRRLELLSAQIQDLVDAGNVKEAEELAAKYQPPVHETTDDVDLSDESILAHIDQAFADTTDPVVTFPGALGDMLNPHLVRGGFVAFMAAEKVGKSFTLLELANRASRQGCNVAFFQAGDMTKNQQLRRICIYRAKNSDQEKYCEERYVPVKDCIHNQLDTCDKKDRGCDHGVFTEHEAIKYTASTGGLRKHITFSDLLQKVHEFPDYEPCYACKEYRTQSFGTVWLKKRKATTPLTKELAKKEVQNFFIEKQRRFKLSTYPNGTLSVAMMEQKLEQWEKEDGFIADIIICDYADLLIDKSQKDERSKQNQVWKDLRGLSQKKHALLATVTQADAKAYMQDSLNLSNFSEDKRKYAHVTAMWGINRDTKGREKELGIVRYNEMVVREGESTNKEVYVLQDLRAGTPFLTSYW